MNVLNFTAFLACIYLTDKGFITYYVKKRLKQCLIGDFQTYFYGKILSAQHFPRGIIFKMRVLLNHQVIWNLNGINAI